MDDYFAPSRLLYPCRLSQWSACQPSLPLLSIPKMCLLTVLVYTAGALWSSLGTAAEKQTCRQTEHLWKGERHPPSFLGGKDIAVLAFLLSTLLHSFQSFYKLTSFCNGAAVPATAAFLKEYLRHCMILKVVCSEWSPIFLFGDLFLPCMPICIYLCKDKYVLND